MKSRISFLILPFCDIIAIASSFFAAYVLRNVGPFRLFLDTVQPLKIYLIALPFAIVLLLIIFAIYRLYEIRQRITKISEFYTINKAITLWILLVMAGSYLYKYDYSRIIVILFWILAILFINIERYLIRVLQYKLSKKGYKTSRVLIIGAGKPGKLIAQRIKYYEDFGIKVIGFIDDKTVKNNKAKVLGTFHDTLKIIDKYSINEVYIANPSISHDKILQLISSCENPNVKFKVAANIFDLAIGNFDIREIEEIPSLDLGKLTPSIWYRITKRTLDLIISVAGLIATFPLWVIIVFAVKFETAGRAILKQKRVGLRGIPFKMYKFRTMYSQSNIFEPAPDNLNDPRITKVGKLLRKTSLDELPQLVNVLKGEMSIVGPRPEMPFIVKKYKQWQRKRLEVKPGITGLWQILGRKDLPLHENLQYDFYYINNQSLLLDITIILKTVPRIISGKGAY